MNNLLCLSHSYANFVKDPLEGVSQNFKNIYCIVRLNPVAELSTILPINTLKPYSKNTKIDLHHKPDNITVFPLPVLYLPTNSGYLALLDKHFKKADDLITKNHLKFNLIHSHFTISSGYVGAKLKEKYGIPLIITAHGYDIYEMPFKDKVWKEKITYVLNNADYILTVSNSNLKCINRLNITRPVKVLPNGYNDSLFYPLDKNTCRKALNLPVDKKIIVTVGGLVTVKGHIYLIEAMERVHKAHPDTICLIVGDGELKGLLLKEIKKRGLEDHIILPGSVSHKDVSLYINACDLFVLPSLSEGNPTVMFESLGCGKPFISTRVGGIPEIITSNEYGFLCDPKDPEGLAGIINDGLEKEWNSLKIYNYSKQYTWKSISKQINEIYNLCIN